MHHNELRKTIVLIFAIILMIVGIIMILNQISISGNIDLSTALISGKIQSGSAGLFICFFSLVMIFISTLNSKTTTITTKQQDSTLPERKKGFLGTEMSRALLAIIIVWILFILSLLPLFLIEGYAKVGGKDEPVGYPSIPVMFFIFIVLPATGSFFNYYIKKGNK
jgi:hypothetical protein